MTTAEAQDGCSSFHIALLSASVVQGIYGQQVPVLCMVNVVSPPAWQPEASMDAHCLYKTSL